MLAGVDAPADITERDTARVHIAAGTYDEEFTYCIQGRYIYEEGRGMGAWSPPIYHTVLGPAFRPDVPSALRLTNENRYITWHQSDASPDLRGFIVKYHVGETESTDYEMATQAHTSGHISYNYFDTGLLPEGMLTVFVKSINNLAYVSEEFASLHFNNVRAGFDGEGIQFVYRRTNSSTAPPTVTSTDEQRADDDYVPGGWTDRIQGVTSTLKWEWVSTGTRARGSSVWREFSAPALFSFFGDPGQDGRGVEFIFIRNNILWPPPDAPETSLAQDMLDGQVPSPWSGSAQGTTEEFKYEWVSRRRGTTNNWGKFEDPSLWASQGAPGADGTGAEFIFTRTLTDTRPDTTPPNTCLLYTSPSPRDRQKSRMPSSA